ncbi:MAG TPA: GNAT family N-acetyltransferase, partial [Candidatus Saccharimonadia bacterium]|nr:GNAT family N-acetyltransferase [Candidatus Saccharimonadia bacterium]
MTIRRGNPSDLPLIQRLNQELFQYEHDQHFYEGDTYNLNWPYEEDGIKYLEECLGDNPASALFVAEIDARSVGYLAASCYARSYRTHSPVGYLDNMYVCPVYRSQGIGTALIDAFKVWVAANGAGLIRVSAMV